MSNGVGLPIKFISSDTVKLEGEYKKLEVEVCSFVSFDVTIKPGKNTLEIHYSIRPWHSVGDLVGVRDYQRYSIWPAKNWVSRFRKALWRVILPDKKNLGLMDISGYKYLFDDWYSRVDCHNEDKDCKNGIWSLYLNKLDITVEGPGDRHEYTDYVDFIADNYTPKGKIDIIIEFIDLHFKVKNACQDIYSNINDDCSKKFIDIHPYFGDKACYDLKDMETYPNYMDFVYEPKVIKYLRNEIFARRGYNFKSKEFSNYFADMSWYSPKYDRVTLSDVEKWNVEFLERVEKSSKNYIFDGEHCELDCEEGFIYEIREKMWPCPTIDPRIKARTLNAN